MSHDLHRDEAFREEELREAARQVGRAMRESLPEPEDCQHIFTPEFERNMAPLCSRSRRMETRRRWGRRVAAAVLALVVGTFAWLAVDSEARAAFIQWIREVYEDRVIYRFANQSQADQELPDYRPSWLPEGYEEREVFQNDYAQMIVYTDIERETDGLIFDYSFYSGGMNQTILASESEYEYEKLQVNGCPAQFYRSLIGEGNNLVWVDEEQKLIFNLEGNLDLTVMLHIAESIKLVK